jgi:hypothetical protein
MRQVQTCFSLFLLLYNLTTFAQSKGKDYWLSFVDTAKNKCGYLNQNGDTVIQSDNHFCFTDTFKTYAIVLNKNSQFIAIDKQQNVLYNVFPFDNGPDYPSDGLFRVVKNNKIGYADEITGKVVIKPQFDCAFPFENGIAKVGFNCVNHAEGEHYYWTSDNWSYINKKGVKVKPPRLKK